MTFILHIVNLIIMILVALMPQIYQNYMDNDVISNIDYDYSININQLPTMLEQVQPLNQSAKTMKDAYLNKVKSDFKQRKYSVNTVISQDKANTPIAIANDIIDQIYVALEHIKGIQYLANLKITNNSAELISIRKISISTCSLYKNPIFGVLSSVPLSFKSEIEVVEKQGRGFVVKFGEDMQLPANNSLSVIIAFTNKPTIRFESSYSEIVLDGKTKSIFLEDKSNRIENNHNYSLYLSVIIFLTIFLLITYRSNIKNKIKKIFSKQSLEINFNHDTSTKNRSNDYSIIPPYEFIHIVKDEIDNNHRGTKKYDIDHKYYKKIRIIEMNSN